MNDTRQMKNITSNYLIENFLDIFHFIGCNIDSKYKKCHEITKHLHEKTNPTAFISSHSSTAGSSANSNHENISEHLEQLKKELKLKELQVKSHIDKINECERIIKEKESLANSVNKKYLSLKSKYTEQKEESKALKTSNKDLKSELDFLREKEYKMMEVMYLLQKRGISIDEVMKEKSEKSDKSLINDKEDFEDYSHPFHNRDNTYNIDAISDLNDISITTVYFPDKVHPFNKNNLFKNYKVKIPKLDLRNIPGYESHSNNESDAINININNNENKHTQSHLIITDCQSNSLIKQENNFNRYNPCDIKNKNKNIFFNDMSCSVNMTKLQYKDFENDSVNINTGNKINLNSLAMDNSNENCSFLKNKSMTSSTNMSMSKLKDSLKNFSISNSNLNSKLKMKQFNGTIKK